ncbi:MAG: MarR family transcriptional regulator [Rubrivivax sp.]
MGAAVPVPRRNDEALDESLIEHVVGYLLAISAVTVRECFHHSIGRPLDLRPVEFTLLMLLLGNPGAAPKQLARALRMPAPNVTALLDRMVARGYVLRQRSAADGRALEVRLTPEGDAVARRAHGISLSMENGLLENFTPGERVLLRELLLKLGRIGSPSAAAGAT